MARRWLALVTLGVGGMTGCLYVGGRNNAPEARVEVEESSARLHHLGSVTLRAVASDADGDRLSYAWRVVVRFLEAGGTLAKEQRALVKTTLAAAELDPASAYSEARPPADAPVIGSDATLTLDRVLVRGDYEVILEVTDQLGARREVSTKLSVYNKAPANLVLLASSDPAFGGLEEVPDFDGKYPAHARYLVRISEKDLIDVEGDLRCGGTGTVAWELLAPSADLLEYWSERPCQGKEAAPGGIRLRFSAAKVHEPTMAEIRALLLDGYGGGASATLTLQLVPNRPPCIVDTEPPFTSVGGKQVLPAGTELPLSYSQQKIFRVLRLSDDVPEPAYRYGWWLRDAQVAWSVFTPVPGQDGPQLTLPSGFAYPGQVLELRVVVEEQGAAQGPSCDSAVAYCASPGERLPPLCYQWVTWKLRFL